MAKARETNGNGPPRDAKGRVLPGGGSLNPGGVPRAALELRRLALTRAEDAMRRAFEMVEDPDPQVAEIGIRIVLGRALGKESAPAELPDDTPAVGNVDTSPAGLVQLSKQGLAVGLAHLNAKAAAGTITSAETNTLVDLSRALSILAKEERELTKEGPGANLPDDALADAVLSKLPTEKIAAHLAAREIKADK